MDNTPFSVTPFHQPSSNRVFLLLIALGILCSSSSSLGKGINYHNIPPSARVRTRGRVDKKECYSYWLVGYYWSHSWITISLIPNTSEVKWSECCSVVSSSLRLHGLYSPQNSPGQNTGVGSLSLLQGLYPGIEHRSPTLQADSLPAEPQGSPFILKFCLIKFVLKCIPLRWFFITQSTILIPKHIVLFVSMFHFSKYEDHWKLHEE